MDILGRKILYELDCNSRQSYSRIAKKVRSSPQVVKYRVEQMLLDGILKYCWPMVEYRKAGYFFGLYFFKLQKMDEKAEEKLFDFLNSHKYIPIIMRGEGYADLIIAVCAKGIFHQKEIITELNNRFGRHFFSCETTIPIGFSQFHREYLLEGKESKKEGRGIRMAARKKLGQAAFTGADVGEIKLKEEERKVLSMVNSNARVPLVEMAKKIGIGEGRAKGIMKMLEREGIIQSYTMLPDHVLLGKPRHRVLLKLSNFTAENERKLFAYCAMHPNIVHHLRVLGNWDLVIDIEIERGEPFRKVIQEMKFKFSDIIQRVEATYIYKIDTFRDIPVEHPEL